jgi:hypothetical protein
MPAPTSKETKFWKRVSLSDPDTCWLWTGTTVTGGYGRFSHLENGTRTNILAHRFSYEHHVGPIPEGLTVHHICRNPSCVNPRHLRALTLRDNVLSGDGRVARQARQTHCLRGHPLSGDNLYIDHAGKRQCRECMRIRQRSRRAYERLAG